MAFDQSKPAGGHQNFVHGTNMELEGVASSSFTVDFINAMTAETGSLHTGSATAGLEATRAVINSYCNILSEGPLVESDKQKTYTVRTDTLGTLISGNTLEMPSEHLTVQVTLQQRLVLQQLQQLISVS